MHEDPILIAKRPTSDVIGTYLGILAFLGFSCYEMIDGLTAQIYPQIIPLFVAVVFGGSAYMLFLDSGRLNSLKLYDDRLEVLSNFGRIRKTIYLDAITSWNEEPGVRKSKKFTVFTESDKYTFSDRHFADYEFIKLTIIKGNKVESDDSLTSIIIIGGVFLLCAFIGILKLARNDNYCVMRGGKYIPDVVTISGKIINPVKVSSTGGRNSKSYIRIILNKYPDYAFDIDDATCSVMDTKGYLKNVHPGDSVFLDIMTDVYRKKITKETPLGFLDKTVHYSEISVYGLRDIHTRYLTPYCDNEKK